MRKRPLAIALAALLFAYFPAEIWARYQSGFIVSWSEVFASGILPLGVAIGLLRVTKIGWYTLIAFTALFGIRDLTLFYQMRGEQWVPLVAHLIIYALSLSYFINPRIRTLYFDPTLCWWKSKPRFETHLPLLMNDGRQWHYPVLRNISDGGCFIETPHLLAMNAKIEVSIPLPIPLAVPVIHTAGEVRWISRNPLRPGMGIQFLDVNKKHLKAIRQFVQYQL